MRTKPVPETAAFGIDIGKKVYHVVALDTSGAPIQRAKFSRDTLMAFFEAAPKVLIGMEACAGSQWLARRLVAIGHVAWINPARFVKPYVKSNKTDTADAAKIAEAVTRPTMHHWNGRALRQLPHCFQMRCCMKDSVFCLKAWQCLRMDSFSSVAAEANFWSAQPKRAFCRCFLSREDRKRQSESPQGSRLV